MSEIVIIAGVSENNVIGASGKLPWHIPEDLKHFRNLTMGHSVVMGRKTFESLGKPLPGRLNIVITNQTDYKPDGVLIANSLEQALKKCKDHKFTFIIGGQSVYEQALPLADRLEITRIHRKVDGDAFFPKIDIIDWEEVMREDHKEYSFVTYMRRG